MRRVGRPHGPPTAVTWLCSDAAASITPLPHSCCKPVPWPTHPGAGFGPPVAPPAWNTASASLARTVTSCPAGTDRASCPPWPTSIGGSVRNDLGSG